MTKPKLCFIIDSEEAYVKSKVIETYQSWGFKSSDVKTRNEWNGPIVGQTLFGGQMIMYLNLDDKKDMKSFVNKIDNKSTKADFDKDDWFGNGLIISVSTAQGSKKIENLVKKSNGTILKKEKPEKRKQELLKSLKIPNDSKKILDYYVGEDYQMLLSFVNEVGKKSEQEQQEITSDKVLTFFPAKPGSVQPWIFMNSLLDGNTSQAIQEYKRTVENTNVLVTMVFLQRQISMLYRIATARLEIPNSPKALAEAIGEKAYGGFWPVYNVAKRTSFVNARRAALLVYELENGLKGNSSINPDSEFIATLTDLGFFLNH